MIRDFLGHVDVKTTQILREGIADLFERVRHRDVNLSCFDIDMTQEIPNHVERDSAL